MRGSNGAGRTLLLASAETEKAKPDRLVSSEEDCVGVWQGLVMLATYLMPPEQI